MSYKIGMLSFDISLLVQIINTVLLVGILYLVYALLFKYPKRNKKRFESIEKRLEELEKGEKLRG